MTRIKEARRGEAPEPGNNKKIEGLDFRKISHLGVAKIRNFQTLDQNPGFLTDGGGVI